MGIFGGVGSWGCGVEGRGCHFAFYSIPIKVESARVDFQFFARIKDNRNNNASNNNEFVVNTNEITKGHDRRWVQRKKYWREEQCENTETTL